MAIFALFAESDVAYGENELAVGVVVSAFLFTPFFTLAGCCGGTTDCLPTSANVLPTSTDCLTRGDLPPISNGTCRFGCVIDSGCCVIGSECCAIDSFATVRLLLAAIVAAPAAPRKVEGLRRWWWSEEKFGGGAVSVAFSGGTTIVPVVVVPAVVVPTCSPKNIQVTHQ